MAACTRCGSEFRLVVDAEHVPEGVVLEGAPCCWSCLEEAAEEIEAVHNDRNAVHR